ncbi:AmmeMemoRadiSam system radical SAM enzyme [bacterium]|nr:AmmeMemoRadiSam system radical SAM enzyme [bacterium]
MKEAMLYTELEKKKVSCFLCRHRCQIAPEKFGVCGVRENKEGKLYSQVYGKVIAAHVDPIEKKPFYHFLPGTQSFSVATIGCNFRCPFCQNWQISHATKKEKEELPGHSLSPQDAVSLAQKYGCRSIAYTYTEPTIFFEYAYDTAKIAHAKGITNVFVTNGYMTSEALDAINPYLDACNVDLKAFSEKYYKEICKARLQPVLDSIRYMKKLGIWVEVTTLVVPHLNDGEEELTEMAQFIGDVDADIPWHISRFHPHYNYSDKPPTPVKTLRKAMDIGKKEGLRYVYIGNVVGESENTVCPHCQKPLIQRSGFSTSQNLLKDSKCPHCGTLISGVFKTSD